MTQFSKTKLRMGLPKRRAPRDMAVAAAAEAEVESVLFSGIARELEAGEADSDRRARRARPAQDSPRN